MQAPGTNRTFAAPDPRARGHGGRRPVRGTPGAGAYALRPDPKLLVLGYWVGVRHPSHVSVFLTTSRMMLPQDASTKVCRTLPLETRYRNSPTGAPMQYLSKRAVALRQRRSHTTNCVSSHGGRWQHGCSVPALNGYSGTVEHAQTPSRNRPQWADSLLPESTVFLWHVVPCGSSSPGRSHISRAPRARSWKALCVVVSQFIEASALRTEKPPPRSSHLNISKQRFMSAGCACENIARARVSIS